MWQIVPSKTLQRTSLYNAPGHESQSDGGDQSWTRDCMHNARSWGYNFRFWPFVAKPLGTRTSHSLYELVHWRIPGRLVLAQKGLQWKKTCGGPGGNDVGMSSAPGSASPGPLDVEQSQSPVKQNMWRSQVIELGWSSGPSIYTHIRGNIE